MDGFFTIYLVLWSSACFAAMTLVARNPGAYALCGRGYQRQLLVPWRLTTFAISAAGMILVAPHTLDPTWDYWDAGFMSGLTYLTAPWAMGEIYLALRKQRPLRNAFVALVAWMFSASWSYDLYLLLKTGYYPATWLPNIFASSVLYVSAGLFWSLEWREGRGATFAFLEPGWPDNPSDAAFGKIFWVALPFMLIVALSVAYFLPIFQG